MDCGRSPHDSLYGFAARPRRKTLVKRAGDEGICVAATATTFDRLTLRRESSGDRFAVVPALASHPRCPIIPPSDT